MWHPACTFLTLQYILHLCLLLLIVSPSHHPRASQSYLSPSFDPNVERFFDQSAWTSWNTTRLRHPPNQIAACGRRHKTICHNCIHHLILHPSRVIFFLPFLPSSFGVTSSRHCGTTVIDETKDIFTFRTTWIFSFRSRQKESDRLEWSSHELVHHLRVPALYLTKCCGKWRDRTSFEWTRLLGLWIGQSKFLLLFVKKEIHFSFTCSCNLKGPCCH